MTGRDSTSVISTQLPGPGLRPVGPRDGGGRLRYVDALRGLAAGAVMLFHFSGHRICSQLNTQLPDWLPGLLRRGELGVQIFFVISGFVIAYSVRDYRMTGRFLGRFALRRSVRLDPPYWFTIAAVIGTGYVSRNYLGNHAIELPSTGQVVAHLFYVYRLFGYDDIYPVFWTLCHEVQFYLLFILLLGLGQRLSRAGVVRAAANGVSLPWMLGLFALPAVLSASGWFHYDGLCLDTWYLFALGVLAYAVVFGGMPWQAFVGVCFVIAGCNLDTEQVEPAQKAVGIMTASSLVVVGRLGGLRDWGRQGVLQFLGMISYSLYLIHGVVGYRLLSVGERLTGRDPRWASVWLIAAVLLAVVCAWGMHRGIEAPSIALARRFRLVDTC